MRRTMDIASADRDPSVTVEMLDGFALVDPTTIPVFSTFEEPICIGHCLRIWREGTKLWAELEIDDAAYWPPPEVPHPAPLHAESVVGFQPAGAELMAVVLTSMPRGMLAGIFQKALERFRKVN